MAIRNRLKTGCDAFEATVDNPLLRAWEYTVAQLAEADSSSLSFRNSARIALGGFPRMEDPSQGWRSLPALNACSMGAYFERQFLTWKTGASLENRIKGVNPEWKPPAIDYRRFITPADSQLYDRSGELSHEAIFLHKLSADIQRHCRHKMDKRLRSVFEADVGNGGRKTPGFSLYDAGARRKRTEWRRIDNAQTFQELAGSVFMDAAREVLEQAYGQLPEAFRTYVVEHAVEPTAQYVLHPDYKNTVSRIINESNRISMTLPWVRRGGGDSFELLKNYLGAPYHIRIGPPAIEPNATPTAADIHAQTLNFANDLAVTLIRNREIYKELEEDGCETHLLSARARDHGFNIPIFAKGVGKNAGTLSSAWRFDEKKLLERAIPPELGHEIVSLASNDFIRNTADLTNFSQKRETVRQLASRACRELRLSFAEARVLRGAIHERAQASLWLLDTLVEPGARIAAKDLSVEEQKSIIIKVLPSLGVSEDDALKAKLLNGVEKPQTPAELRNHILACLRQEQHNQDLEEGLSEKLLCHIEPAPPYVILADLNYHEHKQYAALIHNPFNNSIELRRVNSHGTPVFQSLNRREQLEALRWKIHSRNPDHLIGIR